MTDLLMLTTWRLKHFRLRCLFGFHKWAGELYGLDSCDNCPTDKTDGYKHAAQKEGKA